MSLAVGQGDNALIEAVLVPQVGQLLLQAEAIVPVGRACKHPGQPATQRPEVGILKTRPAADKHQRPGRRQRLAHRLGMSVAKHDLIGADAEHHRGRVLPMAVQVQDRVAVAARHLFN